jgi:hypothetical protein
VVFAGAGFSVAEPDEQLRTSSVERTSYFISGHRYAVSFAAKRRKAQRRAQRSESAVAAGPRELVDEPRPGGTIRLGREGHGGASVGLKASLTGRIELKVVADAGQRIMYQWRLNVMATLMYT